VKETSSIQDSVWIRMRAPVLGAGLLHLHIRLLLDKLSGANTTPTQRHAVPRAEPVFLREIFGNASVRPEESAPLVSRAANVPISHLNKRYRSHCPDPAQRCLTSVSSFRWVNKTPNATIEAHIKKNSKKHEIRFGNQGIGGSNRPP
jgi:hypothetical protein